MFQKVKGANNINELFAFRIPILIWLIIVFAGSVILQIFRDSDWLSIVVFTVIFLVHAFIHWNSYRLLDRYFWLYFLIQSALIYVAAITLTGGYQAVLIGLLPLLISQCLGYSFRISRVILVSIISIIIFVDSLLTVGDMKELFLFLPLFILMLITVSAYTLLFFKQVHERLRIRSFLSDLQEAHQKVEELTLANERQRMARDLHDTLAQGLAGIIMQLEATNAHLNNGHTERATEIIQQAMKQARRTLAEARRAIDDLRLKSTSDINFKDAIEDEIIHFSKATGIQVEASIRLVNSFSRLTMEHSLHIVKESLTNVARHAKAEQVLLTVQDRDGKFTIEIKDDGVGFNSDLIGKQAGHYGLIGIQERVRLMKGKLEVSSDSGGTTLICELPLDGMEKNKVADQNT